MNKFTKDIGIWVVIILALFVLFQLAQNRVHRTSEISFSNFMNRIEARQVLEVTIRGAQIEGMNEDQTRFTTQAPDYPQLISELINSGVRVRAEMPQRPGLWLLAIGSWLPILLMVGIFFLLMRQLQGGGNRALSFGQVKPPQAVEKEKPIKFKDVAGIDECKEEMQEIVHFLKDKEKFENLGGEIPRGVLLMGQPGTGKTLLAKAIAGEAGVPFINISGSDFVEMFVGVGASRVRNLFEQGKKQRPCIIFIDEIDAVGRNRGTGLGGGHDEREQTLNQLLVEMDGFERNDGVIVIAATNRPDVLDPALLRPGRFDRHVMVPLPDIKGRLAILKVHTTDLRIDKTIVLDVIAKSTAGFSGAELANLANEAALWAARQGRTEITLADMEFARDKVMMGAERKSMRISDQEKKTTAYHEAGHALLAALIPEVDNVHKVTIIPRGRALGLTQLLPEEDRHGYTRTHLMGQISMMMGGRVAEELTFQHVTTGASNDIQRAAQLARRMITQWGMSEKVGPICYHDDQESMFLGRDMLQHTRHSQKTASLIDDEINQIITTCYDRAQTLIKSHQQVLAQLAEQLIDKETISGEEVMEVISPPAVV